MENNYSTLISGALNIRAPVNKSLNEIRIKPRTPASTHPIGCSVLDSTQTLKNGGFLDHFIPLGVLGRQLEPFPAPYGQRQG